MWTPAFLVLTLGILTAAELEDFTEAVPVPVRDPMHSDRGRNVMRIPASARSDSRARGERRPFRGPRSTVDKPEDYVDENAGETRPQSPETKTTESRNTGTKGLTEATEGGDSWDMTSWSSSQQTGDASTDFAWRRSTVVFRHTTTITNEASRSTSASSRRRLRKTTVKHRTPGRTRSPEVLEAMKVLAAINFWGSERDEAQRDEPTAVTSSLIPTLQIKIQSFEVMTDTTMEVSTEDSETRDPTTVTHEMTLTLQSASTSSTMAKTTDPLIDPCGSITTLLAGVRAGCPALSSRLFTDDDRATSMCSKKFSGRNDVKWTDEVAFACALHVIRRGLNETRKKEMVQNCISTEALHAVCILQELKMISKNYQIDLEALIAKFTMLVPPDMGVIVTEQVHKCAQLVPDVFPNVTVHDRVPSLPYFLLHCVRLVAYLNCQTALPSFTPAPILISVGASTPEKENDQEKLERLRALSEKSKLAVENCTPFKRSR